MSTGDLRVWCHGELRAARDTDIYRRAETILKLLDTLDRAIKLLHMLDAPERRHPDVAEFLDTYEWGSEP